MQRRASSPSTFNRTNRSCSGPRCQLSVTSPARKCEACGYHVGVRCGSTVCERCASLRREINASAQQYGQMLARKLIGDGRQCGGFEDDPITYWDVGGWPGGPVPQELEAQLTAVLSRVFREDARRMVRTCEKQRLQKHDERNQNAFEAWVKRKDADARRRSLSVSSEPEIVSRPHISRDYCERHFNEWCYRLDAQRRAQTTQREISAVGSDHHHRIPSH